MPNEAVRAWLYRVALAVLAALSLYGLIGPEEIPAWTGIVVALFSLGSTGLATANTSTKPGDMHRLDRVDRLDRGESTIITILAVLAIILIVAFLFGWVAV